MRLRDETKKESIYAACLSVVAQEGIAGVTMQRLARKAKLATGTVYIYFKNKEELFHSLYQHLKLVADERFMKGYDPKDTFERGFRCVWMNYLKHRIEHYEESVFMEQYYRSPYITEEDRKTAELMKSPFHKIIEQGKCKGLVKKDLDNELILLSLLGIIRELAYEHVTGTYELNERKIEKAIRLSWSAVKN